MLESNKKAGLTPREMCMRKHVTWPILSIKLSFAIFVILSLSVTLTTSLNYLNFNKRLTQTTDSKYNIVMQETLNDINHAIGLGMSLDSISNIQDLLDRHITNVSGLNQLKVTAVNNTVLYEALSEMPEDTTGEERQLTSEIYNAYGQKEGDLTLTYSLDHLGNQRQALLNQSIVYAIQWIALTSILSLFFIHQLTRYLVQRARSIQSVLPSDDNSSSTSCYTRAYEVIEGQHAQTVWSRIQQKHTTLLILLLAFFMTFIANFAASIQIMTVFSDVYQHELNEKSAIIAHSILQWLDYLLASGFNLENLRGLENELTGYLDSHHEIIGISINNDDRTYINAGFHVAEEQLYVSQFALNGHKTLSLSIASDKDLVAVLLQESLLDMVTILVASLLVVTEVIVFLCNYMILSPWRQLQILLTKLRKGDWNVKAEIVGQDEVSAIIHNVNRTVEGRQDTPPTLIAHQNYRFIRLPLFLFVFAEASSLSFFPNYVGTLEMDVLWLPDALQASFPISLFMLVWAISLPFAGYWSDKVGRRHALMFGGTIIAAGMMATSLCESLSLMLVSRAVTALGYGLVFISAQGYVTDYTDETNRTKGMATFLSAFFSGSLCGAAIGGILADRIGYSETFFLASGVAVIGVTLVWRFFNTSRNGLESTPVRVSDFVILLSNKHFALISFLSAIPAKIVLTGFLYYLCPVYLQFLGESNAMSGRVLMVYGLAIVIISPLAALWIDKFKNKFFFVVFGGLLSSVALLNIYFFSGTFGLLAIVLIVGIAHSIGVSPQIPLIMSLMKSTQVDKGKAIGIFRLTERIGNVTGPLLTGALLSLYGFNTTVMLLGALLMLSAFTLIIAYYFWMRHEVVSASIPGGQ